MMIKITIILKDQQAHLNTDLICQGIIIWTFTTEHEFELLDQPVFLTISMYQIWCFVLWWTRNTWEWPEPNNTDKGQIIWKYQLKTVLGVSEDQLTQGANKLLINQAYWLCTNIKFDAWYNNEQVEPESGQNITLKKTKIHCLKLSLKNCPWIMYY